MKHKILFFVILLSLLVTTVPFLLAENAGGRELLFNGFLLNPLDGNSYLAKMQIGWEDNWIFKLPYTAEPGTGGYLFLFYIFLGHLSRWLNFPLLITFHLARVLASIFLIVSIYVFCRKVFNSSPSLTRWSFLWIALGSGLGWLLFPFGLVTSDILVPEAYPLLSEFVNPHFPLGLGLLLWVFIWSNQDGVRPRLFTLVSGLALAVIQPFAVVIGGLVLTGMIPWQWLESKKIDWQPAFWFLLGGGPFLVYQFWISTTDPVLAGWNVQNLTPSPPLWDLVVSFSPALILAVMALVRFRKWQLNYFQKISATWLLSSLALILVPFSLQRRFLTGFFVPVVILACIGVTQWVSELKRQRRIFSYAFTLSIPTLLVILLIAGFGISAKDGSLYRTAAEQRVFPGCKPMHLPLPSFLRLLLLAI